VRKENKVSPARTTEDEFAATITAGASKDGFDSGLPNELLGTTPQLFGTGFEKALLPVARIHKQSCKDQ